MERQHTMIRPRSTTAVTHNTRSMEKEDKKDDNIPTANVPNHDIQVADHTLTATTDPTPDVVVNENSHDTIIFGSICYVIRRPGCSYCRQQALSFSILALLYPEVLAGFNVWGIVKEISDMDHSNTNNTNEIVVGGLHEFVSKYFFFPSTTTNTNTDSNDLLYCDKSYAFYNALGNRKIALHQLFMLVNPKVVWQGMLCASWGEYRWLKKSNPTLVSSSNDSGNNTNSTPQSPPKKRSSFSQTTATTTTTTTSLSSKGEGLTLGGIIILDAMTNQPIMSYEEDIGTNIPLAELVHCLDMVRQRYYHHHHAPK